MRGLYAILDLDTCTRHELEPMPVARALLSTSPAALQVRAKNQDVDGLRKLLALLREEAGTTPLVINDHWELAESGLAGFVHIGQGDIAPEELRQRAPHVSFGISTHSLQQLEAALHHAPSYVAIGPVFETRSKMNPEPVVTPGILEQAFALARAASVPLVTIGGIDEENLALVVRHCDAVAMIGALLRPKASAEDGGDRYEAISARARRIQRAILEG